MNSDGKRLTLASGTYKLVVKGRSKCNVFINNGVNSAKNEGTFTITDGHNDVWCFIEAPKGLAINETIYPMIQLASSTDESYEPYTGGKPSPSPDYPQEIKSVVNPTIKVIGKNLWKIHENGYINNTNGDIADSHIESYGVTDFIKMKKNIVVQSKSFDKTSNYAFAYRVGFYDSEKKWIQNIIIQTLSNPNIVDISSFHISNAEYIRVSAPNTIFDDLQIEYGTQASKYEPYKEQSIALPITLNAIPVSSGGNITINGKQYIADYVDVGKNKRVGYTLSRQISPDEIEGQLLGKGSCYIIDNRILKPSSAGEIGNIMCSHLIQGSWSDVVDKGIQGISLNERANYIGINITGCKTVDEYKEFFKNNNVTIMYQINPIYSDLLERNSELSTYYPVTNISANSEQLDGYAVFNYPISLANGWNYIKQQLNDNRDYIYDMDLQSAEAYVNSEYAVTLTELEV